MPYDADGKFYTTRIEDDDLERIGERAINAAKYGGYGMRLGAPLGPAGAVVGATLGGIGGFILGDQEMIFPVDMIAIPAYQAFMIAGTPAFQIYIKEGEMLHQVIPTDAMEAEGAMMEAEKPKKKRKANPWIKFSKSFDYRKKRKNESAQAYLSARNKAASRAYKKNKGGTKKGQVRKTARRAYEKKK